MEQRSLLIVWCSSNGLDYDVCIVERGAKFIPLTLPDIDESGRPWIILCRQAEIYVKLDAR